MTIAYDLIVIGAGSGGLTAAEFAAKLGIKVALIEKGHIGGDCTWTGCIPSKALLKVAKVAHTARTAGGYGIDLDNASPQTDMHKVRDYIQQVIAEIAQHETAEYLTTAGIDFINGTAQFLDSHTVQVGEQILPAKKFIIATGAHPFIPPIPGLTNVPFLTYLDIFDNARLPERLLVIGAGPIGAELAQAYQRLGSQVTLLDVALLPREEPEVNQVMGQVFANEGLTFVTGLVSNARMQNNEAVLTVAEQDYHGDMLLIAVGRAPVVTGLGLDQAGVSYTNKGIQVDPYLRTNHKHIYAIGDCVAGNYQFTHLAGWQGFQAARNALLPMHNKGFREVMAWTTFTDPEVAHTGLTEAEACQQIKVRQQGAEVQVTYWPLSKIDRAVTDNDRPGFIKVVYQKNGKLLGATIVAERAGEMITEFTLALERKLTLKDLAQTMHVYPTYSMGTMRLAAQVSTTQFWESVTGSVLRKVAGG